MIPNPEAKIQQTCQEGLKLLKDAQIRLYEREISDLQQWSIEPFTNHVERATRLKRAIVQRSHRVPFAYITGEQPFYHRNFGVTKTVLIPRPETEHLVSLIIPALQEFPHPKVIDCGTGSGAIAITIAAEVPRSQVIATDQSAFAIDCARENAQRHTTHVDFRIGNLLTPCQAEVVDAVIANLPYLPSSWTQSVDLELRHEPPDALFSGTEGLDCITRLLQQLKDGVVQTQLLWLEMLPHQISPVTQLIKTLSPDAHVIILYDLGGTPRYLQVEYSHG